MTAQSTPDQDTCAQRLVEEGAKDAGRTPQPRGPYQRDRARILHSAAFRRLAAKTQVRTAGDEQYVRTRLTHSLEVAQICRDMGARLGCDPDLVDAAGLAHDLGHPPFGHNGEQALDLAGASCGGFEGNAQTLRLLTKLEAKVLDPAGNSVGLNLTRATLDAVCKYPWPRTERRTKFGVYAEEADVFAWLRDGAPDSGRCLEAQVMDWADDVAYSVHDVEDGIHAGQVAVWALRVDRDERAQLCADVAATYSDESPDALGEVLDDLLADPLVAALERYDASLGAQVALKQLTSVLTGRFVAAAVGATVQRYGRGPLRRYAADLVVPSRVRAQCALLKGMALRYVMRSPAAQARYAREAELILHLVTALTARVPDGLEPIFVELWRAAPNDSARMRVVIDQVSSLTDPSAMAWYRRLVG